MISRRSVRIKVAQSIYSHTLQDRLDPKLMIEAFGNSIEKTIQLNISILHYIQAILNYCREDRKIISSKKLKDAHTPEVSLALLDTDFAKFLNHDQTLAKHFKIRSKKIPIIPELVKKLYFQLKALVEYQDFCDNPTEELAFLLFKKFFTKVLFSNQELEELLEDEYENAAEDMDLTHFALKRALKDNLNSDVPFKLSLGHYEWKKEAEFAEDLIKCYVAQQQSYEDLIKPNLKGWDIERIPKMQIILIKMAIVELLNFETIPVNVTLNEYVDLTKIFSDTKAKTFINGLLNNLLHQLTNDGKITKTGRGLK